MSIEGHLEAEVLKVIRENLDLGDRGDVEIRSISVDEAEGEIRIVLDIHTGEDPSRVAKGYFGLTGQVREALGDKWRGYFPVITPTFEAA